MLKIVVPAFSVGVLSGGNDSVSVRNLRGLQNEGLCGQVSLWYKSDVVLTEESSQAGHQSIHLRRVVGMSVHSVHKLRCDDGHARATRCTEFVEGHVQSEWCVLHLKLLQMRADRHDNVVRVKIAGGTATFATHPASDFPNLIRACYGDVDEVCVFPFHVHRRADQSLVEESFPGSAVFRHRAGRQPPHSHVTESSVAKARRARSPSDLAGDTPHRPTAVGGVLEIVLIGGHSGHALVHVVFVAHLGHRQHEAVADHAVTKEQDALAVEFSTKFCAGKRKTQAAPFRGGPNPATCLVVEANKRTQSLRVTRIGVKPSERCIGGLWRHSPQRRRVVSRGVVQIGFRREEFIDGFCGVQSPRPCRCCVVVSVLEDTATAGGVCVLVPPAFVPRVVGRRRQEQHSAGEHQHNDCHRHHCT
mmetsp:Transcript_46334/g.142942  ORF Transcript_46334/g.142942 Transcript_46334/m.142942 type:complete len:417 (-) Transcript_46334:74-1324(-)